MRLLGAGAFALRSEDLRDDPDVGPGADAARYADLRLEGRVAGRGHDERRGLTSGVLRNIEAEVVKSTAKLAEQVGPVAQRAGQLLHDVHTAMQPYREGKAVDATYYQGLLVMYEMFTTMGDRTPVQTLASQLERKPETIRTQLNAAVADTQDVDGLLDALASI